MIKNKKGFTLIELLVTISIISLLSSITLASLNDVKAKARDAKRVSEMKAMQYAIQIAKTNGIQLPDSYDYIINALSGILVPTYIPSIPVDPNPSAVSALTYFYCNKNTQSATNFCHNDTNPDTYAIVFFTERNIGRCPKFTGYWLTSLCCLTSEGIFPSELGNNPGSSPPNYYKYCTQR